MTTQNTKTFKALILFSGTKSFEKGLDRLKNLNVEYRGLDMDNKFEPYYNVNILEWDYINDLKDFIPDYIHSSFVCCEFSNLKNGSNQSRNLDLGYSLLNKSLEIFDYVKCLNPNVLITAENPRNKFVKEHIELNEYNRHLTHYCKYGFKYQKPTFIFSNIVLDLYQCSKKFGYCEHKEKHGYHAVVLGFKTSRPNQVCDSKYFSNLRKQGLIPKGFNNTYMRYRIPDNLIDDILKQILKEFNNLEPLHDLEDLIINDDELDEDLANHMLELTI